MEYLCRSSEECSSHDHDICNSCNMGSRDLPDMYAWGLGAAGPAEGIHIKQITRAHVTSNMYHLCTHIVCG